MYLMFNTAKRNNIFLNTNEDIIIMQNTSVITKLRLYEVKSWLRGLRYNENSLYMVLTCLDSCFNCEFGCLYSGVRLLAIRVLHEKTC